MASSPGTTLGGKADTVNVAIQERLNLGKHSTDTPLWILAGDFNFTEESAEYALIRRMNFIDTVPEDGKHTPYGDGSKASGEGYDPTLTLDYIFAGPKFISLNPAITLYANRIIHDHSIRASDHYPMLSSMELGVSSVVKRHAGVGG